jgi:hypothetical protein
MGVINGRPNKVMSLVGFVLNDKDRHIPWPVSDNTNCSHFILKRKGGRGLNPSRPFQYDFS